LNVSSATLPGFTPCIATLPVQRRLDGSITLPPEQCAARLFLIRSLPDDMSERNLFAELKQRNVYKVAVAYAVVSGPLIQIAAR
jgi:hypothetical protein